MCVVVRLYFFTDERSLHVVGQLNHAPADWTLGAMLREAGNMKSSDDDSDPETLDSRIAFYVILLLNGMTLAAGIALYKRYFNLPSFSTHFDSSCLASNLFVRLPDQVLSNNDTATLIDHSCPRFDTRRKAF